MRRKRATNSLASPTNRQPRRGASVLLVLALVAMTLALSYAMLRTQSISDQIQYNYDRRQAARQAAITGLNLALRHMQQPTWQGVDVPLNGNLGNQQTYAVSFQTGDPRLQIGDPEYGTYPYRVTVNSIGRAGDATNPAIFSEHQSQAVVQLVPRKLADAPESWADARDTALFQWGTASSQDMRIELPCQVRGTARIQNRIELASDYPHDGDDRPFAGKIDEVAIFAAPLSDTQLSLLNAGTLDLATLTGDPSLDAIAWWRLDEGSGAEIAVDQLGLHHGKYDGARSGQGPVPDVGGLAAASFDGFNDQVVVPILDAPGAGLTITAWFRADHFQTSDARIISKATGLDEADHYWMLSTTEVGPAHRLQFRMKTLAGTTKTLTADSGDLSPNQWVFAAAVFDGLEMKLYLNGIEVGSTVKIGLNAVDPTVPVSIGNNPPGSPRARYLRDLTRQFSEGGDDYRTLTGPLLAPRLDTAAETRSLIEDDLNVAITDTADEGTPPVNHPGEVLAYQLYPGGSSYQVPEVGPNLDTVTLAPDPLTNPLGLYKAFQATTLGNDVSISGTMLVYDTSSLGDLQITGQNVTLTALPLPQLYGDPSTYRLPAAIVGDDFKVFGGTADVSGKVVAGDDFDVVAGSAATECRQTGGIIAKEVELEGRTEWNQSMPWWRERLREFFLQIDLPTGVDSFPAWLEQNYNLIQAPKVEIKSSPASVAEHWQDWAQPLFVPHPDDGGLRWDVVSWRE